MEEKSKIMCTFVPNFNNIIMIHLESDYNNGMHPSILEHFMATNNERSQSYGADAFSERAREWIRRACDAPEAQVYFLSGGTQANATIIDCVTDRFEGVIAAETGHINVHEAGAVEFTGHKVIALPSHDGRLSADDLERYLRDYDADDSREHCVRPGMVYITFPTELGTLYTADEIRRLHAICKGYGIPLYVDGARLSYGLAASPDVTLPFLAQHCDIFYIGGTKCGAICGEAVVFPHGNAPRLMLSRIKQHGALLAKSRVVGVQFERLFAGESPLYLSIGTEAIRLAMRLRHLFVDHLGYRPFIDSPTNQQFFIIPNADLDGLRQHIGFETWCPWDERHTACRFVTSWATTDEEIDRLFDRFA